MLGSTIKNLDKILLNQLHIYSLELEIIDSEELDFSPEREIIWYAFAYKEYEDNKDRDINTIINNSLPFYIQIP